MNKLGLVGNVAGNVWALRAILRALDEENVPRIASLGNLVGRLPGSADCLELALARDIRIVKGMSEAYCVGEIEPALVSSTNFIKALALQDVSMRSGMNRARRIMTDGFALAQTWFSNPTYKCLYLHRDAARSVFEDVALSSPSAESYVTSVHVPSPRPFVVTLGDSELVEQMGACVSLASDAGKQFISIGSSCGGAGGLDDTCCYAVVDVDQKIIHFRTARYDLDAAQKALRDWGELGEAIFKTVLQ